MKATLYLPGTTIEDVDIEAPPLETMQARGIPDHPGEHTFVRWPAMDKDGEVAYRLETAEADAIVAAMKEAPLQKVRLELGDGRRLERELKVRQLPPALVVELPHEGARRMLKTDRVANGAVCYVEEAPADEVDKG